MRWLGGGTGAGKSSIAAELSRRAGVHVYDGDEAEAAYVKRCTIEQEPFMHGETFPFVIENLLAMPRDAPVVDDDLRTLPREVTGWTTDVGACHFAFDGDDGRA